MLRRLTLVFIGLGLAAVAAACSTNVNSLNNGVGVGPNFPANSVYAAISSQNQINIWPAPETSGATAPYQIGGSSTTIDGPQFLAFDSSSNLWITNYDSGTLAGKILEIKALATGNVLPLNNITYGLIGSPRGIAIDNGTKSIAVATTVNAAVSPALPDQIQFYFTTSTSASVPYLAITGSATQLNFPSGVAYDTSGNVWVANRQGASVASFVVPSPTPTPSPTTAPSPTATPSTSPSPTPTPTPYALHNLAPHTYIFGSNTGFVNPTGVALDANNVIYVVDAGNPSVRVFAAGSTGNVAPIRTIAGSNTLLTLPTDVKVDTNGLIYVADPGAGKILVFAATASGNVAPTLTLPATSSIVGVGLSP